MNNSKAKSISPTKDKSNKYKINIRVFKELDIHHRRSVPRNSSRSQRVLNSINFYDINSDQKNSDLFRQPSLKSSTSSLIRQKEKFLNKRASFDTNLLSIQEKSVKIKSCCIKPCVNKMINKYQKLFSILNNTRKSNCNHLKNSENIKPHSMLNLKVEKNLHEEYIKDRVKFKLGHGPYIVNKKL